MPEASREPFHLGTVLFTRRGGLNMRSRKLLYAYGIAAIAIVALVTSAVFVGLSGGNPTPLQNSGARVDEHVQLVGSEFAPVLPESEARAQAVAFLKGPWGIDEPTLLPIRVATGAFTGLREDTNTQTSNLGVWVVVFHDFPAHARVLRAGRHPFRQIPG